jgi:UDP-glucose 4-epimerase
MDLAEGHAACIEFLSQNIGWHVINLGAGKGYSVLEMIAAFEMVSCRKIPYKVVARRPGDVAEYYANPKKAEEILRWRANRNLEEMCASTWRFHRSLRG